MNRLKNANRGVVAYIFPIILLIFYRIISSDNISDDAYIILQSAKNLAHGNGLVFNSGENIFLVATPLWAFLIAGLSSFGLDISVAMKLASILFELFFLVSSVYLAVILTGSRKVGLLFAVFMCTHPVYLFTSFSGMEISLFLLCIMLTFIFLANDSLSLSLLFASYAVWVNFEGILVYLVIFFWLFARMSLPSERSIPSKLAIVLPSVVILGLYFIFGLLHYGTIIPHSVLAKNSMAPSFLSTEWFSGTWIIFRQIGNSIIFGRSAYWFTETTLHWTLILPAIVGFLRMLIILNFKSAPMLLFTVLYSVAFIFSGNYSAQFNPWSFVPILIGMYFFAAWGSEYILTLFAKLFSYRGNLATVSSIFIVFASLMWVIFMHPIIQKTDSNLVQMEKEREGIYITATLWANEYLPHNSSIAAHEIGAIGFYSRDDIQIIDTSGILRKKSDRKLRTNEIIKKYQPELILAKEHELLKAKVKINLPSNYKWYKYKNLEIGVRHDLDPVLSNSLREIYRFDTSN